MSHPTSGGEPKNKGSCQVLLLLLTSTNAIRTPRSYQKFEHYVRIKGLTGRGKVQYTNAKHIRVKSYHISTKESALLMNSDYFNSSLVFAEVRGSVAQPLIAKARLAPCLSSTMTRVPMNRCVNKL